MNTAIDHIRSIKCYGTALCFIFFPIMLLLGFLTHPNLMSFEVVSQASEWVAEWRHRPSFHLGHLLVLFTVPQLIVCSLYFMSLLQSAGAYHGYIGAVMGIFGAFMLAVDKGALTLVLSAFQTLPDKQIEDMEPALQTLLDRDGLLWITWLFLLLPLGYIVQTIGLLKERLVPRWQGACIITGLLMLINPDVEIISAAGAVLMCVGFMPIGLTLFKRTRTRHNKTTKTQQ